MNTYLSFLIRNEFMVQPAARNVYNPRRGGIFRILSSCDQHYAPLALKTFVAAFAINIPRLWRLAIRRKRFPERRRRAMFIVQNHETV